MTPRNRIRLSKLSLGLLLALAAAPSFAQNTTAAVGGRISDASGHAIAGADVTILHTESGSVSHVTTDADGRYVARGLRVGGPYTITIVKDGKSQTREGVYLALAQTTEVDASLAATTTLQSVEVTGSNAGSPLFSSTAMGAGTSISREQLTSFASIQRNLQDYARLDPRLSQTDKERGEMSAGGQNTRYNSITIDSVATSDTFGLEANNLPTLKQPVSIDAIQSVQVNVSNYDVTQKGYTGANINAVTKSGTNDFHGSVYYVYRNDSISGDRIEPTSGKYIAPPNFKEDTKGMTFGGPLMKDRLFFFTSYEELKSTRGGPVVGPVGSSLPNIPITPAEISGAQAVSNGYGFEAGSETGSGVLDVKDELFKLDANLSDHQRASLRWSKTIQAEPIFPDSFAPPGPLLSLSSHWYTQNKTIESYVGQLFSDWTDNFSTELKVSYRDYASTPVNNSNLPQVRLNFSGAIPGQSFPSTSAGMLFGTERSRQFNDLGTKTRNIYLAGDWFLSDHELKFGADYDDNQIFDAFLQDTKGNYTFGCINSSGTVTYTNPLISGGITCNSATRAQIDAAVLENYQRGRPTSYQVQVAAPGHTINDGVANWGYQNLGVFLQDSWAVNDKLTLNYGVRFDQIQMNDKPLFNAAAAVTPVDGVLTPAASNPLPQKGSFTRATGGFGHRNDVTLDGQTLLSPRIGFNYTFASDRPTQLRGGLGLFQGAAMFVWLTNPYTNTGMATRVTGCGFSGVSACPSGVPFFNPDPNNQPVDPDGAGPLSFGTPTSNVDFLASDLKQPSVWKANLAFEHELPFHGIVFSAEYIRTEVKDGLYYQHLNLGEATHQGVDGRNMFWTPAGYNTNCFNSSTGGTNTSGVAGNNYPAGTYPACSTIRSRALNNAAFNNVLIASHTGKGSGDNLTFSLSGKIGKDWDWNFAYSFTRAKEVSPLTSSVSNSSWQSVAIYNSNEEVAANSAYLVKDRFAGQLNWKHIFFGSYATRVGLFYEGRSGKPYSWIYNNDLNGDGATNDLMYIPVQGASNVVFKDLNSSGSGADEEARFWHFVHANHLEQYAGHVVPRNSSFAPWTNTFDVRFSQELPGFFSENKVMLTLDILNVGNLLNKHWGHIDEIGFQSQGGNARSFVNYLGLDKDGNYIYGVDNGVEKFVTRQVRGESQWAAQVTLNYSF